MGEKLIISISGLRGIVGENLTPTIATAYGCAFGSFLKERYGTDERLTVCIGRDSRPSGSMIAAAVSAGLSGSGIDVIDLGLVTTPSVGIMVRELGCSGGIVITASHNPLPYNGVKLLLDNGMAPPPDLAARIRACFKDADFSLVDSPGCGTLRTNDHSHRIHVDKVLAIVGVADIQAQRFKVVLDSVNGAGGPAGRMLLDALGCNVVAVNSEPTGLFAHAPEPTKENLVSLSDEVIGHQAHIGFAQDPDADRLAIVDHQGTYIGEEFTLALAAQSVMSEQQGSAAANLSTSRMIDDVAACFHGEVFRTAVGEANVAAAMLEHGCVIGGEGNGGVIDLRVGPIRDSLVGMALVLDLMTRTGKSLQELAAGMGAYAMLKDKFRADSDQADQIIKLARATFREATVDTRDGCRFDLTDGWIHLRVSNTEPVMRMIIEANDPGAAQRYAETVLQLRDRVFA
ncbi:phosphoglucosamine mutase [Planctomycetota bacterium]